MVVVNKKTKNMKSKKLIIVGSISLLLLALVLIRAFNQRHFRNDLSQWAAPSLAKENMVSKAGLKLKSLSEPLLVNLDHQNNLVPNSNFEILNIEVENILDRKNLTSIRKHKGSVVLMSEQPEVSARTWMLLSQMGLKHLYLLGDSSNEPFRYEFRPDTVARPEF